MGFQQTTATDWRDLLDKLYMFATGDGWTGEYDNESDTNKQIGLSLSNCEVCLGEPAGNPIDRGGGFSDAEIRGTLSTNINDSLEQYWNQPGSPVTTQGDGDAFLANDFVGPMSNVWFMSGGAGDPEYVHVIVQSSAERYAHFSFGNLDKLGMTVPDIGFLCGLYYEFWDDDGESNNPSFSGHDYGWFGDEPHVHTNVLANTLPAGYPAAGIHQGDDTLVPTYEVRSNDSDYWASGTSSHLLDFFYPMANQLTTGGTQLWPLPWFFRNGTSSFVVLGILPGIRLVDISNHTPASTLTFGSDEWLVFPFKRKGLRENLYNGGDPEDTANTVEYGMAYKKNT